MKSKKRSAANSKSKPPSPPPFFADRSVGKNVVPSALRKAGATCHVHDDHFEPGAPDGDWLKRAGAAGWVVITKDTRIRYREPERAALIAANVRAFVFTTADLNGAEMADRAVKALPAITRLCHRVPPPFIARIGKGGRINILFRG